MLSNKNLPLCFFAICFMGSFSVMAEDAYIDETDLFDDVQTVESATRLKQKITDTPVSVTIIDSAMIEASGATEIHELLRLVPGFLSYSVWGNLFGVTRHYEPRDFGSRLEVQVNGRSVYEPLFTAIDWTSLGIDVADIDYIEVVRGSSATTYGSNAFLGAINIVTKDILSRPKTSIRTALGNIGRKDLTINHSGNVKDIDYGFSMVYRSNTGFDALPVVKRPRDLSNDDRNSLQLSMKGNYVPNLENEIRFDVGIGRTRLEVPGGDIRGYSNREHETNYQQIKWIYKLKDKQNTLQFYHNYLGLDDDSTLGLVSDLLQVSPEEVSVIFPGQQDMALSAGPDNTHSERYDIEFEQKNSFSNIDYVWGLGARRDTVKSLNLFGKGNKSENRFRLFGNIDWHINEKANANFGLFLEHTRFSGTVYSPRVALNLHPKKGHTFRASITQGKLAPSVTLQHISTGARFPDGQLIALETIRDDTIKEEQITAYELAYIAQLPQINTQLDVKLFREEMRDFVGLQLRPYEGQPGGVRVWDNILNLTTQGIELQGTHKFNTVPGLQMRLAYAYLETEGTRLKDISDPESILPASSVPKHSGTLLLTKKLANQFDISSVLQYQSDFRNRNADLRRVDLRIGKKLKLSNSKAKVDFVIQNAFNKFNDFSPRNVFKPRAFVRLQLDF